VKILDNDSDIEKSSGRALSMVIVAQLLVLAGLLGLLGYRKLVAGQQGAQAEGSDTVAKEKETTRNVKPRRVSNLDATVAQRAKGREKKEEKKVSVDYYDRPLGELRRPSLLIEKSKLRLTVFDGGRLVKCYRAAVGAGRGEKTRQGDLCTPEGEFVVCVKNPVSKYVLSLGLSYPNRRDAERGLRDGLISEKDYRMIVEAVHAGRRPPWNTPLGGEIMIHGRRDGGRKTQGCIALEDDDIRELYPQIPLGAAVAIRP
jgi:murein L,D-transpeptidase YafK